MPVAIVGLIATLGVPGLVGAGGALTLGGSLLATGIGLGISYGVSALFSSKPSTIKPQDVKSMLQQSVLTRRKHRGLVRTGGGQVLYRSRYGNLYMVIYLGEGPTSEFVEHYIDKNTVTLDANGYVQGGRINGNIRIETRKGLVPETHFSSVAAALPEIWGVDHRGDGCISVAVTGFGVKAKDFNSVYPNRIPAYEGLRRDGVLYDPRTATLGWSANLNLIYLDYLRDPDGGMIAWDYFDENDFSAAADIADQILPTNGGGTVRRYHGQLSYDLTTEPSDIIEKMETATDSRIYLKGNGKIGIHPGIWEEPTIRIDDGCISSFEMSDSSGPLREANEITLQYTNPLSGYSAAPCDPWRDEADISSGGVKTIPIEAYEIQNHHHGRRVQKLRYCRASARWQGKIVTDLWGIQARGERRILLEIKELGIDFEPFEIEDLQEDDDSMTVIMDVRSCSADMYVLSSAEEGTPPPIPPSLTEDQLDQPQNLIAVGGQRAVGQGNVATIVATWDAYPGRSDLTAVAQLSPADAEQWTPIPVDDNQIRAEAIGLVDGALYDVRVEWVKPTGTESSWTLAENIRAVADPVSPIALLSFTQTAPAPHLGNAVFGFQTANDSHLSRVKLFRKASGAALNLATDVAIATLSVSALSTYPYTDGDTTRANGFSNPDFDTDTVWSKGTGWTISGGVASHAAGTAAQLLQTFAVTTGQVVRLGYTVSGYSAGEVRGRLSASSPAGQDDASDRAANGSYRERITAIASRDQAGFRASATFVGSVDSAVGFIETGTCAPQGVWDYYAVPFNGSGIAGPASGPVSVTIV
jgi:hypothetical protein